MARKPIATEATTKWAPLFLLFLGLLSVSGIYMFMSTVSNHGTGNGSKIGVVSDLEGEKREEKGSCCRGVESLELWGSAVKWGSDFKLNSAQDCCKACKEMCSGNDGPCLCDSWVFCGNKEACGEKFGECWLKKQKDSMIPDQREAGDGNMWTSGIVFGEGEGIVGLETKYGTIHIKLLPDYSLHSVFYILELLKLRSCPGCHFYRSEGRGKSWDSQGNHIKDTSFGPPFALIQGTLDARGLAFNKIPRQTCSFIRRGSVAWVESGPEFFISLANHDEWENSYTVFGSVLPEDMKIADKIAKLPTLSEVWNGINVSVLDKPVSMKFHKVGTSKGES
ncbi:hypothetical protein LIER_02436 [Lithospermum erythrorhizon]|uniref:PPIase cyclophilin-type domain-containing protein n=1 Tax=Lithospermum erythrorhizon TaxID=34254 RepID=A0AAV3NPG1_LITER